MSAIVIVLVAVFALGFIYVAGNLVAKLFSHSFKKSDIAPTTQPAKLINSSIGVIDNGIKGVKLAMVVLVLLLAVVAVVAWLWVWLS